MMDGLRQYILSVITAAFILGILNMLLDKKGSAGTLFRLLGGLFLTFTIISPLVSLDFSGITDFWEEYTMEGESTAAAGEAMAESEYRTIIKDKLEAYILDKAKELGLTLNVDVMLGDDGLPEEVIIQGAASPYSKRKLQQIICEDIGVAKENQLWIG